MSSLDVRHPDHGQLLLYLDGELASRKARQIRSHLEACWQCRTELQALETTVADCVKYRNTVLAQNLPPAQWKPLDFDSVEAELAAQSWMSRLTGWLRAPAVRWAVCAAAALTLVFVAVNKLNETPKVEAATLLRKAVAITEARPHSAKRVRITTAHRQITRVIYGASRKVAGEDEVAALFQAAHYDWNDPLSARAYADWYGHLSHKWDQIDNAQKDSYVIKTITDEGELLSATLKMRATDFEAMEGRFEFRNREWVEMTELVDQQTLPASTVAGTTGGVPRQPGTPPAPPSSVAPEPVETTSPFAEELQVFAALRQTNADLGDPIEVTREGREVMVSGTGVPPSHQEKLHALLDRLPHVTVRFSDPSLPASNPPAQEPVTRDAAGPERPKYPARLEARLGGRPQFERFSGQVLDWTDAVMARMYALHRLAKQFPAEDETRMTPEERRSLHTLLQEHATALARDLHKITNTVNPVFTGIGGRIGAPETSPAANWQTASEELYTNGRKAETQLASALGVSAKATTEDATSLALTALAQFSVNVDHYLKLIQ